MKIVSPEATGITVLVVIVYTEPFTVTSTEPVPLRFAFSVRPPVTNTAVAVRLLDTVADTVLSSECRDAVLPTHLENVLPFPVAVMYIVSPEATGITVLVVIVYTEPFTVTSTEPVPVMFAVIVKPPVTNTAVAVRLPDAVVDTLLLNKFRDAVSLTHLENVLPIAVMEIVSPEAIGITVSSVMIYAAPLITTAAEPVPLIFAVRL